MGTACKAGVWRAPTVTLDNGPPFEHVLAVIRRDIRKNTARKPSEPSLYTWKNWDTRFWAETLGTAVEELGTNALPDLIGHRAARPIQIELEIQMFEIKFRTRKPFHLHKLLEVATGEGVLTLIDQALVPLEELLTTCLRYANAKLRLMRAQCAMARCRTAYRWKDYFDVIQAPRAAVFCNGSLMDCPERFCTKGRAVITCYWNIKHLTADPIVATNVRDDSLSSRMLELVISAVEKMTSPKFNEKARFGVLLLLSGLQNNGNLVKYMNFAAEMLL